MQLRIGIWAGAGALVVVFWTFLIAGTSQSQLRNVWPLIDLTCPIALARHHALSIYFVLLVNAATYALLGSVVEFIRQLHGRANFMSN